MDPSTSTEQKKQGLYDKASGTKEAVKQAADDRIPEDVRDETSSSEIREKGLMGKIRGIRVCLGCSASSAETHAFHDSERHF